MNRKEYYKKLTDRLNEGITELGGLKHEYDKVVEETKSDKYSGEYKKELYSKAMDLKSAISKRKGQIEKELGEINSEYADILRAKDALNPEELTADSKLLTSGVKLTAKDVRGIMDRNPNNRTMYQLALRYAKEHDMDEFKHEHYYPAEEQVEDLNAVLYTAKTVLKWYDSPKDCDRMYDQLLGEGSDIANWSEDDSE